VTAVDGPRRILVRAPNWIGDVVLSLAAVRDLRRRNFPDARIEVLARPWVADLYRAVPEVDGVRVTTTLGADVALLRGLFDAAVLLPNSFGAAFQAWRAGIPERWGYATDGRGALLTRAPRVPPQVRGRSQVYYYRAMLAGAGLRVSASPDVSLRCPPEWADASRRLLADEDGAPWVAINPGAAFGTAKRWLPERFAAVGDALARRGARVTVVGGAAERRVGEAIAGQMTAPARVLCGQTTLAELAGVLSRVRLLVTNDSGPMHLAAALGRRVVAVFGPTDWRETHPVGAEHRLVRESVHCSPCRLRECPIDHRCMRRVTIDRVLGEVDALLEA
jgi:lipopolysaccharide heptosyltransferase II